MSTLYKLANLAADANSDLIAKIDEFKAARKALIRTREDQSVAIRALAAVKGDDHMVRYGQEVELRAANALGEEGTE